MCKNIQLLNDDFLQDPYRDYAHVREECPVYWHEATAYWWLTRYDDVHFALRQPQFKSARLHALFDGIAPERLSRFTPLTRLLESRLLLTDGANHQRLRSLISTAFAPRHMDLIRPVIRQVIEDLLGEMQGRTSVEFIREFADPLPSRVITRILGLPAEHYEQFKSWTNDIYQFMGVSPVDRTTRAEIASTAAVEIERYLDRQLDDCAVGGGPNLLSVLKSASEAGERLSRTEIIANVVGLLNAGHETTTNLLGNGMYLLLTHAEQAQLLSHDRSLWPSFVEEVLRYESPVQIIARQLSEATEMHGVPLPAGANVLLFLGAANRDPRLFWQANQFDIQRQGARHLAFGFGPHFCIGAALARMITVEAFACLSKVWRSPRLAVTPRWRSYPVFRGLVDLQLHVTWQ
ncbi:Cytochrome P450 107B1 [Anatilimnocola aggregata]|uniref:Cytochrome P450 107B1 n=1 Tax=Anatilimnocola aggregata TaxID=2528021 RepID=A0A517YFV8_9BACT|nr:cytochrome P450 [Anatilimnocola aggregata]QDU29110.1 Cytochrome P450 107B1 [Anatilimnocola aggregata]